MRRVHLLSRAACAVTAALVMGATVLAGGTALADDATTTIDVLKIVDGEYVVETVTAPARTAEATAEHLEGEPDVVVASPSVTYQLDAGFDPFWDTTDPQATSAVRGVWPRTRGAGQVVAVLDSTADISHPDLAGAIIPGTDAVGGAGEPWHGYGVAGVIAARAENNIGSAGMAPQAQIMPVRVCNAAEGCPSAAIARGVFWAADHGADVINLSLSGVGYSDVSAAAIQYALDKNISVVASAGNDGLNGNPVMYPAALSGVIGVSSTAPDGTPSNWAVNGWQVDMSTVGDSVLLTYPGGTYASGSGTSFSGPAVAGAVALIRASHPGISTQDVQAALQAGADSSGGWNRAYGAGRLDVPAAFDAADRISGGVTVTPDTQSMTVAWDAVAGATAYDVRVDGTVRATVTGTSTQVTGLTDGTQLAVDVQPSNGSRSRPVLTTVGPALPGTPTLVSASLRGTSTSAIIDLTASLSGGLAPRYSIIRDGVSIGSITMALTSTPKVFSIGIGAMPTAETRWQLRAVDALGRMGTASNVAVAAGARPSAPAAPVTGLAAQAQGAEVLLTWDDLGSAYSYRVQVGTDVIAEPRTAGAVVPAPPPGGTRTYSVTAVDGWTQTSPAATVSVTMPDAPVIGAATAGNASARVTWTAPAGGPAVTGYLVHTYRDAVLLGTTPAAADATSATVSDLTNGVTYRFTVAATTAGGTGPASALSSDVLPAAGPPSAPGIGSPTPGNGSATVRWSAPADTGGSAITGYTVRAYSGSSLVTTSPTTAATRSATISGLTNGTAYSFTVTATNSQGESLESARSAVVTPAGVPAAPTIGTPVAGAGAATARWTAAGDGGSPITGYTISTYADAVLVKTTTAAAGATSADVTGLANGTAYTFTVAAVNAMGTGAASAHSAGVTPRTTPGAPVIQSPTPGDGSAEVRWQATSVTGGASVTGYVVRTHRSAAIVQTTAVGGSDTSANVGGLTNGTAYTFSVAAVNAAGTGTFSSQTVPVTPRTKPGVPVIDSPIVRSGSAVVRWSAPATDGGSPVTGYTVRTFRGATDLGTTSAPAGATSVIVPGLDNGTAYTFTVTATNAAGTGFASPQSTPVIPAPVPTATDLSIVHRLGSGMNLWRMSMLQSDSAAPRLLASLNYGGFSYDGSVTVPGDFGEIRAMDDGSPDEIIWHAQPNGGVLVWAVGGGPDPAPKLLKDLRTGGWSWALSRPLAGDVTGDGIDDLVVRHANGPASVNLWVLRGDGHTVGDPELWGSTTGGLDQRAELADVDGDGRDDLVLARPVSGSSGLVYDVLRSSGSAFGTRTTAFTGAIAGGWSPASRLAAGDVTGDGRVDLVTLHAQVGNPGLLIWVHENCSTGPDVCFRAPQIWQDLRTGGWSYADSRQYLADTDADGDADLISLHAQVGNPGLLVWRHPSDGSRLLTPQIAADLRVGGWTYLASRAAIG